MDLVSKLLFICVANTLVVNAIVEILWHSVFGGIFWRPWSRMMQKTRWLWFPGKLTGCPYCYGHWVGFLTAAAWVYLLTIPIGIVGFVLYTILLGLVSARGAQWLNDFSKPFLGVRGYSRTPNDNPQSATQAWYESTLTPEALKLEGANLTTEDSILNCFNAKTNENNE